MTKKIKKNTKVKVISGKDKNKVANVISKSKRKGYVLVSEVNLVYKHLKNNKDQKGSIVKKEMPINISNLKILE